MNSDDTKIIIGLVAFCVGYWIAKREAAKVATVKPADAAPESQWWAYAGSWAG